MAWPPATLPVNRVNATPQNNTHPADHNAISQAINDTVGQLATVTDNQNRQGLTAVGSALIGTGATLLFPFSSLGTSAWGAGPTFTAPSGTNGMFIVMANVNGPTVNGNADIRINVTGGVSRTFNGILPVSRTTTTVTGIVDFVAGTQTSVQITNPATMVPSFYNVEFWVIRVAI